jgi:predicted O-methyltransferase YrrM
MYGDAPLHLIGSLAADALTNRRNFTAMLRNYMDIKSCALGVGKLPTRTLAEVVPTQSPLMVTIPSFFDSPAPSRRVPYIDTRDVTPREAVSLVTLLHMTPAHTIVEFGTSYGDTALLLALNAPEDAIVLTTDWPERPAVGTRMREYPSSKVNQVFEKTGEWDLSAYRGRVDFAFIDASHTYQDVVGDSHKALDLLAPSGIVAWHDYRFKFRRDVVRALDEIGRKFPLTHLRYTSLVFYQRPHT